MGRMISGIDFGVYILWLISRGNYNWHPK